MEATNILQTYELNDEVKVHIIKRLSRKVGTIVNTDIHQF